MGYTVFVSLCLSVHYVLVSMQGVSFQPEIILLIFWSFFHESIMLWVIQHYGEVLLMSTTAPC